jgi:hypothetical protein
MLSPFSNCCQLVSLLHPKYLENEQAVHMADNDLSEVLVVLHFFVTGLHLEGIKT